VERRRERGVCRERDVWRGAAAVPVVAVVVELRRCRWLLLSVSESRASRERVESEACVASVTCGAEPSRVARGRGESEACFAIVTCGA
jgi:hypothetical protein